MNYFQYDTYMNIPDRDIIGDFKYNDSEHSLNKLQEQYQAYPNYRLSFDYDTTALPTKAANATTKTMNTIIFCDQNLKIISPLIALS